MTSQLLIEAKQLIKSYDSPGGEPLQVLRGIDLEVREGEIVAVMGLSGVGKSTLLNILGLLDHATSGELRYHEGGTSTNAADMAAGRQAALRNRFLGFVFQFYHLLPDLNVLENVLLPSMITRGTFAYRRQRPGLESRATELLQRVGIADRVKHRPPMLSGGERQRVAIARALMNQPRLLLCDEPTGNLDTTTSEEMHDLFVELNEQFGTAFLIVTHDPSLGARAHRCLQMVDGRFTEEVTEPSVR